MILVFNIKFDGAVVALCKNLNSGLELEEDTEALTTDKQR